MKKNLKSDAELVLFSAGPWGACHTVYCGLLQILIIIIIAILVIMCITNKFDFICPLCAPKALVEVFDNDREIQERLHLTDPNHHLYAMHSKEKIY